MDVNPPKGDEREEDDVRERHPPNLLIRILLILAKVKGIQLWLRHERKDRDGDEMVQEVVQDLERLILEKEG